MKLRVACAVHISILHTVHIAWTILGSYILISYGESPHETEAANQYWPINEWGNTLKVTRE